MGIRVSRLAGTYFGVSSGLGDNRHPRKSHAIDFTYYNNAAGYICTANGSWAGWRDRTLCPSLDNRA